LNLLYKSLKVQSTTFPQNRIALCKTCEKETFFLRKVNEDSNLYKVEKKIAKMQLICFFIL
jgi:hypothetical protein